MKRSLAFGFLGVALAATALPALAQRGPGSIPTRIFDQADANHDGRVTEPEAMDFLAARFTEADTNRDGGVTPEELNSFVRSQVNTYRPGPSGQAQRQPPPEAQRRMTERQARFFRMADANRDGRITMDELRPMAAAMFRGADANGDGALEKNELPGQRGPRGQQRGPARGETRPL